MERTFHPEQCIIEFKVHFKKNKQTKRNWSHLLFANSSSPPPPPPSDLYGIQYGTHSFFPSCYDYAEVN